MSSIELFQNKTDCCGCSACYNVCPRKAISMQEDEYGYVYPVIDQDKCVGCGLCRKVCHYQADKELRTPIKAYAAAGKKEEFLKKAVALVEKNLDNSEYSVELFSDDMCMSRMNLYRKLQSITGQKPTEFIRSIRLKKAARLLTDTELSVVEISEKVGFATPSYFSKCFKEMFGVLPTQYH